MIKIAIDYNEPSGQYDPTLEEIERMEYLNKEIAEGRGNVRPREDLDNPTEYLCGTLTAYQKGKCRCSKCIRHHRNYMESNRRKHGIKERAFKYRAASI